MHTSRASTEVSSEFAGSDSVTIDIPFDPRTGAVGTPRVIDPPAQHGRHRARSVDEIKRDSAPDGIASHVDDLPVLAEVKRALLVG